jgi:hypothetical protein
MKAIASLIVCSMLFAAATACACTDPSPKKAVKASDDASIVYEYFRPAKLQEKKKESRTLSQIADSILTSARQKYEAEEAASGGATNSARLSACTKATPKAYQERAEVELYRIKSWADSICNSFRRGYYKIGPEDAPR